MFVCIQYVRMWHPPPTPTPVSGISDYLGFLVGSVVSIATLLPSVSDEGLLGFAALWERLGMPPAKLNTPILWWSGWRTAADYRIIEAFPQRHLSGWFKCFLFVCLFVCLFDFFLQCTCKHACKSVEYKVMWWRNLHRYINLCVVVFFPLLDWQDHSSKTLIRHISIIKLMRICALDKGELKCTAA